MPNEEFFSHIIARTSWDDDGVRFVLHRHVYVFIVLVDRNNSPRVDLSLQWHISLIPSQLFLLLFRNAASLMEKHQIPIFGLPRPEL
jgi:hypothetical protein